jgi:penicillin amidase
MKVIRSIVQLEKWNNAAIVDKAASLIFHLWMKEIPNILFKKEIPKQMDGKASGCQ